MECCVEKALSVGLGVLALRGAVCSLSFAERRGTIYIQLIAPAMRSLSQGVNYLTRGDVSSHVKTLLLTKITRQGPGERIG